MANKEIARQDLLPQVLETRNFVLKNSNPMRLSKINTKIPIALKISFKPFSFCPLPTGNNLRQNIDSQRHDRGLEVGITKDN